MARLPLRLAGFAAVLILGAMQALPVFAQTPPPPIAVPPVRVAPRPAEPLPSEAKIAIGINIFHAFQVVNLSVNGGINAIKDDPYLSRLSPTEKTRFFAMIKEELYSREAAINREMAIANVGPYSETELNDILTTIEIPYVQQMIMSTFDPAVPAPEKSIITPAQMEIIQRVGVTPYFSAFFNDLKFGKSEDIMKEAIFAAIDRFEKEYPGKLNN